MAKVLTLSIAAYNVQEYIDETLRSLEIPSILSDLEVFIIDDGGNDETLAIAKKYEEKYPDTFHAIHKENGGYGSTVTWSVHHAHGKYFKLLDGDDWFDERGTVNLIQAMKNTDADVVVSGTVENYVDGSEKNKYDFISNVNSEISVGKASELPVMAMWAYAFKTSVVKETYIGLPLHTLYTDQFFVIQSLSKSKLFKFVPETVYHWRIGRYESSNNIKSIQKHFTDIIDVSNLINEYYKENNQFMDGEVKKYVCKRAAAYYSNSIMMLLKLKHSNENLRMIRTWENKTKQSYREIFDYAGNSKKLTLLRKTCFLAYWFL